MFIAIANRDTVELFFIQKRTIDVFKKIFCTSDSGSFLNYDIEGGNVLNSVQY